MNCDLCECAEKKFIRPNIAVCSGCGFVYVDKRRSQEEIAKSWGAVYGEHYNPEWPGVRARLFYVAEFLDQNIGLEGKSVLDIGAGDGFFLEEVRRRGGHPVGLDPSPLNARKVRAKGIHCFEGWVPEVSLGQYDLVTLNWTLENCADCVGMMKFAASHGKQVSVATGSRILVPFKKPLSSYFGSLPEDLHCFRWSANSLMNVFQKVGMPPIRVNDFDQNDVLLVLGSKSGAKLGGADSPNAVIDFFDTWGKTFP